MRTQTRLPHELAQSSAAQGAPWAGEGPPSGGPPQPEALQPAMGQQARPQQAPVLQAGAPAIVSVPWNCAVRAVLRREWALVLARPVDMLVQALFFAAVASLPALSVAPTPATLALLAPGVLWVAALLSTLMAGWRCFHDDMRCGWLDQWTLGQTPLVLLVTTRLVAQWGSAALPVLLLSPLVALQYGLSAQALWTLMLALVPGIGVLVLLVGVVAALSAGLRQGGLLVIGLVLPLAVPVLVFGSMAVRAAQQGQSPSAHLELLAATCCAMLACCPWLAASAVRIGVES